MRRRDFLQAGLAAAAVMGAPAIVRAQAKEILVLGPSAQAKMLEGEVFPLVERQLGCKILFDGSTSIKHLQTLLAQRGAPKASVAMLVDSELSAAADEGVLDTLSPARIPNLARLVPGAVVRNGAWATYKIARFSVGVNKDRVKPPLAAWAELWEPRFKGKVLVPSFPNTQGPMTLAMAAHLETGKPIREAQYDTSAGLRKLKALKPNLLNVYQASPQAITLLEQGEAFAVVGLFSSVLHPRIRAGVPVELANLREGSFGSPNSFAKIRNAPAPELADAFMDALLEPPIQQLMMERTFDSPVRPEVKPIDGVADATAMVQLDHDYWAKNRARIADDYAAAFA